MLQFPPVNIHCLSPNSWWFFSVSFRVFRGQVHASFCKRSRFKTFISVSRGVVHEDLVELVGCIRNRVACFQCGLFSRR